MVSLCDSPGAIFSLAAFCGADFDSIVRRLRAQSFTSDVTSFGRKIDRYRSIYLELSEGRYAEITKYNSQKTFEIGLQRNGWIFMESELKAVADFIGIEYEYFERYCNPPIRWL